MARIKQLSAQEAQKIAAGEVVERPANIVKELIENSLDAGATQISIYIHDSGKSLIRVIDNGCGMSNEDAHLCFNHHATSKITSVDDLASLATFGFRGEALSSISSISKVTLITKESEAMQGIKLILEDGVIQSEQQISAPTGTDITITDLFYNVPARKKFLKSNDTEWRQIMLLFQAFCLDYQQVHFKLFSQDNLLFNCPPVTDHNQRIAQLWDHRVAQQTVSVHTQIPGIKIEGIISNHTYTRYDRSSIFFFVNKRWIKNYTLSKALLKGYLNVLPADKFPLACIAITVDCATVDVNIHPRKEEVQFLNPRIIENALCAAIKEALEKNLSAQLGKPVHFNPSSPAAPQRPSYNSFGSSAPSFSSTPVENPLKPRFQPQTFSPSVVPAPLSPVIQSNSSIAHALATTDSQTPQPRMYHIIGQFHKTYILIEQEENLFLVDQHAAHERILYELFSKRFENVAMIPLMFPQIITLSSSDLQILEPHLNIFTANNIALEVFGANQLIIQAIPVHLKEVPLEDLIHQAIGWIEENQKLESDQFCKKMNEKLHAQMACKAAVKAGDILTQAQMHQLLSDLEKADNRFTCPHGRPTGWEIPLYEIEKKFKRKL